MGVATAALSVADLWDEGDNGSWIRTLLAAAALLVLLALYVCSPVTCQEVVILIVAVLATVGGYHSANGAAALGPVPVPCVTMAAESDVSEARAEAILRRFGSTPEQAEQTTDSFKRPIDFVPVRVKRTFRRYFSDRKGDGRYLTRSRFLKPVSAERALHLPYFNQATKVQVVTVTQATMVLEGGIYLGKPSTKQFFVLQPDSNCFHFGPGKRLPG